MILFLRGYDLKRLPRELLEHWYWETMTTSSAFGASLNGRFRTFRSNP